MRGCLFFWGNESLSGAVGAAQAVAESGSSGNRAGKTFRQWEQIMPELQELTEGEKARIYDEVVWKIRILVLVVLILLAGILLLALPAAWKWFVGVYFPLLRYIVDSAAEMPDLYSGYGVRLFASSLSLPAMFFILHLVVKRFFAEFSSYSMGTCEKQDIV